MFRIGRGGLARRRPLLLTLAFGSPMPLAAASSTIDETDVIVTAPRVANTEPASSYASLATALRFDPRVEIQQRGLAEGQADVTLRGGLFENNALNLGALSVRDPQTGHYLMEVPLDPRMLTTPEILTGVAGAAAGLNASVATLQYGLARIETGGGFAYATGNDDLAVREGRLARSFALDGARTLGAAVAYADSRSDGSRPHGDHDFRRIAAQLQLVGVDSQTDLLLGDQDKFHGWPGEFTGFASLPETDETRTRLAVLNHRHEREHGWWEAGGYHRGLEDDYDFDRRTQESGVRGAFQHETSSYGAGARGVMTAGALDWHWSAQLQGDELEHSTDLIGGTFDERRYARFAVLPERTWQMDEDAALALRAGLLADYSDRDKDVVTPAARLLYSRSAGLATDRLSLEYTETSQVPGYTALKSPPTGLFGGNPDLGRERAEGLALTVEREAAAWYGRASAFQRQDDDLVDWTYAAAAPFVRQANPVDMDVLGLEIEAGGRWSAGDVILAYAWLDKDANYGAATVEASYYALNYAEQRMTLAARWLPAEWLDVRFDNRVSRQRKNALRTTDRDAWLASITIGWHTPLDGLTVNLAADNLADEDFQFFPGTPAPRRQLSLRTEYAW
jgi:vitamin B12 transporter